MNKKMSARVRIATLAVSGLVAGLAGGFAMTSSAQAQAWFELRTLPGPRYYEEPPPPFFDEAPPRYYRESPPRYRQGARQGARADVLPRNVVRRIVARQGFEVIGPIRLTGDVYIVPVEDMRGRVRRLVVDAREGEIVDRSGPGGPPRPPVGVGRYRDRFDRDRFATAPEPLPPLPFDPRGWNEYEYDGPMPPPPPRKPAERKAGERAKPKPAAKQQAARTPQSKPGAAKSETSKPEVAKPDQTEASKPEPSKPDAAETETARRDVGNPAEAPAKTGPIPPVKPTAPTVSEEARVSDEAKPSEEASLSQETSLPQEVQSSKEVEAPKEANTSEQRKAEPKEATPSGAERRNASILLRPAQKSGEGGSTERGSVAEGPTVSTGAEPQRKAPRVVYPAPAGSTPEQNPANAGE